MNPSTDTAALDRAVRIVMPIMLRELRKGLHPFYPAIALYRPRIVAEYHRQRNAAP